LISFAKSMSFLGALFIVLIIEGIWGAFEYMVLLLEL
jgi:hypothetical protein